ncbi:uncharacterized protein G2W53_020305 [Senna tora]|uniref:Uncharacterized protein n=1 Tax=Senna tora TaxID=362788 RepID=A0A834TYT5_9FABA|nr:uncharacterized protein G2W53_020305 [Senna tora]
MALSLLAKQEGHDGRLAQLRGFF